MDSVFDYDCLISRLKLRLRYDYAGDRGRQRMLGLCFARPTSSFAKNEIFPQIPDWHCRSGTHIDFYFAGFTDSPPEAESIPTPLPGRGTWYYSSAMFNTFRKQIESRTRWEYSGGSDLILVSARYRADTGEPEIDFSGAIACQLDAMKDAKAFSTVEQYFESIFRFAENSPDRDPT